ncbi:MAG: ribosome maturation factor RimM [Desulfosudaceae bacterium]
MAATANYLPLGRITGAHGIKGNLKVSFFGDDSLELEKGTRLVLEKSPNGRQINCTVRWCKPHGRLFLMSCQEITSREQAQAVTGHAILISRTDLPALENDTYYWDDIIGLRVFTREEKFLGSVTGIIPTGGNDVYVVVEPESQAEILIPAVKSVIEEVDVVAGIIRVTLPDVVE